jgi:steroid delta-isomerase-like uncharacterized protein
MSPRNLALELVQSYYDHFNAGRRAEMMSLLADEVVHDINQGGTQIGREAFTAFMQHMDHCYREQVTELALMANEDGSRIGAEFYILGEYLRSDEGLPEAAGQRYRLRVGAFFEVRGERIERVTNYYNLQDWLQQVNTSKPQSGGA